MNFENFYNEKKVYFESGIVREVYSNENFCICSVADLSYVLFTYSKTAQDGHIGIMINKEHLNILFENDKKFETLFSNVNKEDVKKRLFVLSNSKFSQLKQM